MNKQIEEAQAFEKKLISEAFATINKSLGDDYSIEAFGKAYAAMLRLKERFGQTRIEGIYNWLRGWDGLPKTHYGITVRKRLGSNVWGFLQQQPIPKLNQSLEYYQEQYNFYIHPELCRDISREGQFYLAGNMFMVTRLTSDGLGRAFPNEGPYQLFDSYLEALKQRKILIAERIANLSEAEQAIDEEICYEEKC